MSDTSSSSSSSSDKAQKPVEETEVKVEEKTEVKVEPKEEEEEEEEEVAVAAPVSAPAVPSISVAEAELEKKILLFRTLAAVGAITGFPGLHWLSVKKPFGLLYLIGSYWLWLTGFHFWIPLIFIYCCAVAICVATPLFWIAMLCCWTFILFLPGVITELLALVVISVPVLDLFLNLVVWYLWMVVVLGVTILSAVDVVRAPALVQRFA